MADEWGQTGTQRDHGGVRRLQRRVDRRFVAGVAGGFADYLGIPPWVVRLAFVGLTLAGGAGVLLYVAGWLLIPAEGDPESIAQGISHRALAGPAWAGALLLFIGAALLATHTFFVAPAVIWGLGFIGLGIYLFFRADQTNRGPTPGPGSWATTAPGTETIEPSAAGPAATVPEFIPPPPPPSTAPTTAVRPRSPRERSLLGWFVLGVALAAVGVLGFFDEIGAVSPRPVVYAALALTIVGTGLLISAWVGRARWLIAMCLLLAPLTAVLSPVHVPIEGGFGNRYYLPAASGKVSTPYRLVAGQMTINLEGLGDTSPTPTVTASVVAGRLRVLVPDDATVALSGDVAAGAATVFGSSISGRNLDLQQIEPVSASAPDIILRLDVTYGDVTVDRAPSVQEIGPPVTASPSPPATP